MKTLPRPNVLLVDDQPGKLLTYETVLRDLDATLVKANSAREALDHLLRTDFAVVLVDVFMPELDGFELAAMIREHPRFKRTAIIFVSGIALSDLDRLRGYECGAVDYVPVPVVPEILRAKVRVFVELHQATRSSSGSTRTSNGGSPSAPPSSRRRRAVRTSSSPCSRTNFATRWPRSSRRRSCCACPTCHPNSTAPPAMSFSARSVSWRG